MFSKSSWLHLRIPFSFFLLPVYLFSLSISPNIAGPRILWTFLIIHLLLYPASNGYNSYFDKDEKSIGGLKHPPPVSPGLYYLALAFDAIAIVLGWFLVNREFALMLFVYGLVSKAYSHPAIRLKKYALLSWFITGTFQGFFTFLMCYIGINQFPFETLLKPAVLFGGALASLMLWANYPMTQIYQHEEDRKRGDETLSIRLGIRGTFHFTAVFFALSTAGFLWFFNAYFPGRYGFVFLGGLSPVVLYFGYWYVLVRRDESKADYTHVMRLNLLSSLMLNAFFIYLFLESTQIMQAFR